MTVTLTTAPNGGWTQASKPQAVYYNGVTYVGYIDMTSGNVEVITYTHSTGAVSAPTVISAAFEVDTHAAPSLLVRDSDKRIVVAYSKHNGTSLFIRVSTNPEDISSFAAAVNLDASVGGNEYTYPTFLQLTGVASQPIYIFFRNRNTPTSTFCYTVSTDDGATWSAKVTVVERTNYDPYWQIDWTESRVHVAITDGGPPFSQSPVSIYHMYLENGSTWHESDGTLISAALPMLPSDATLVYDGTTLDAWPYDLAIDHRGYPVFVYEAVPFTTVDYFGYARWDGSAWSTRTITTSGGVIEAEFSTGLCLDPVDPNIVYASQKVGSHWEIVAYSSQDGGTTWIGRDITSSSSNENLHPRMVRNGADPLRLIWLSGTYTSYLINSLAIKGASINSDGPGIWIDWDGDGFDEDTTASTGLVRLMPSGSGGANDNITEDVMSVTWRRGASLDHVSAAGPGGGSITVKNGANANEPDKYNPDNTGSSLSGKLRPGRPVWGGAIRSTAALSGTGQVRGFMAGYVTEIIPTPVPGANPSAEILWEDALGYRKRATASVEPSTARSHAQFRDAILDSMGENVDRRRLDNEAGMLPFSAADTREGVGLLDELNRATATRHWIAPADSKEAWYDYATASKTYKLDAAADADINADDVPEITGYRVTYDNIINEQRATVSPIDFSPLNATQWTYPTPPLTVTTAQSVTIWADFEDYVFDASLTANSSGGTLTSTLTNFGKTAKIVLTATGSTVSISDLRVTGRLLVRSDNQTVVSDTTLTAASQRVYGTLAGSDISSDFIGQTGAAQGLVDFLAWKFAEPLKRPSITIAGKGALTWNYILDLDLFDIITLTVDRLDVVSRRFEIIGISGSIVPGAYWSVTYELQQTPNQAATDYFTVNEDSVNGSALIAPF